MVGKALCISMLALAATAAPQNTHNLPVLFQFSQPGHNVAVFRGADLKKAIASGLVSGFGNLGGAGAEGRDGRSQEDGESDDGAAASSYTTAAPPPPTTQAYVAPTTQAYVAPTTTAPPPPPTTTAPPPPPTTIAYVAPTTAAPVYKSDPVYKSAPFVAFGSAPVAYRPAPVAYRPAPVAYRPAPIVYKPAPAPVVYRPAPAPIVYKPAPAPIVYKPAPAPVYKAAPSYAEPGYADIPAKYDWEYAVKDDYTNNDFGAKESRDGYLTSGKYYVALPDGRLQTVTYVVDGGAGYVPVVEYAGEAQYPPEAAPATYSV